MEQYKNTVLVTETAAKFGATTSKEIQELKNDCDYVMEHFYKGNWSYPTIGEFVFFKNAIQMSDPDSFEPVMRQRIQELFETVGFITEVFNRLGQTNINYRLEDVKNIK